MLGTGRIQFFSLWPTAIAIVVFLDGMIVLTIQR